MPITLSAEDIKAFTILANDDEDRVIIAQRAARHPELKDHPVVKGMKEKDDMLAPLHKKLEDLEKWKTEREANDRYEGERNKLRQRGWKEGAIKQFERRLMEDKELPVFQDYFQGAEYIRVMDNPLSASTSPIADMAGIPMNSDTVGWRQDMESDDRKVNPIMMSRRERRVYNRKKWETEKANYMDQLGATK